jgi:hypothetical protein
LPASASRSSACGSGVSWRDGASSCGRRKVNPDPKSSESTVVALRLVTDRNRTHGYEMR